MMNPLLSLQFYPQHERQRRIGKKDEVHFLTGDDFLLIFIYGTLSAFKLVPLLIWPYNFIEWDIYS
jgi:hypothetical protein